MADPPAKRRRSERMAANNDDQDLLNLPDEIIAIIFSHLDFADRSKARVNRRLASIESTMNVVKEKLSYGCIETSRAQFKISCRHPNLKPYFPFSLASFARIARNFEFRGLKVVLDCTKESHWNLIEKICSITAQEMRLSGDSIQFAHSAQRSAEFCLPLIRDMVDKIEHVDINYECTSISFDDVSCLREIIRGSSKKNLGIFVTQTLAQYLANRWFGVRISLPSRDGSITRTNSAIDV
ncbi:hypothetical protein PFISCL1PPCAC_1296, partial [Pristionchus fissidentatus]